MTCGAPNHVGPVLLCELQADHHGRWHQRKTEDGTVFGIVDGWHSSHVLDPTFFLAVSGLLVVLAALLFLLERNAPGQ